MNLLRSAATVALAIGALASPAQAVPFSLSTSTTSGDTVTEGLTFARFNPALGTLTGVNFALTLVTPGADATASLSANFSASEGGSASGQVEATFAIDVPGQPGAILGTVTIPRSCVGVFSSSCSAGAFSDAPSFLPGGTVELITTGLSNFIDDGINTTFDAVAKLTLSVTIDTCEQDFGFDPGICEIEASAQFSGQLDINYIFEPSVTAPVPVPASMVLFGAGLAGLAALRRRNA